MLARRLSEALLAVTGMYPSGDGKPDARCARPAQERRWNAVERSRCHKGGEQHDGAGIVRLALVWFVLV